MGTETHHGGAAKLASGFQLLDRAGLLVVVRPVVDRLTDDEAGEVVPPANDAKVMVHGGRVIHPREHDAIALVQASRLSGVHDTGSLTLGSEKGFLS